MASNYFGDYVSGGWPGAIHFVACPQQLNGFGRAGLGWLLPSSVLSILGFKQQLNGFGGWLGMATT